MLLRGEYYLSLQHPYFTDYISLIGLLIVLSLGEGRPTMLIEYVSKQLCPFVAYCAFVKFGGRKIYEDDEVYYTRPTTTLECHVDDTIGYPDVVPEWRVVEGSETSDYDTKLDQNSGNKIAVYTFPAESTATVVLLCSCASSLPPCGNTVRIKVKGM